MGLSHIKLAYNPGYPLLTDLTGMILQVKVVGFLKLLLLDRNQSHWSMVWKILRHVASSLVPTREDPRPFVESGRRANSG